MNFVKNLFISFSAWLIASMLSGIMYIGVIFLWNTLSTSDFQTKGILGITFYTNLMVLIFTPLLWIILFQVNGSSSKGYLKWELSLPAGAIVLVLCLVYLVFVPTLVAHPILLAVCNALAVICVTWIVLPSDVTQTSE